MSCKGSGMKTRSLWYALWLYSIIAMPSINAFENNVVKITSKDLQQERAVFKRCWRSAYQDSSLRQLGFESLAQTLQQAFDQEEQDYSKQEPHRLFFHTISNKQVVGYVSFEIKNQHAVYIRQIALLPEFCTVDAVKELIFVIFDHIGDISCVHMTLHRQAVQYLEISKELGFVPLSEASFAFDVPVRLQFHKCGTCLCDLDYDNDEDKLLSPSMFFPEEDDEICPLSDDEDCE